MIGIRLPSTALAVALGLTLVAFAGGQVLLAGPAAATHQPADKMAVSASVLEVMSEPLNGGSSSETVELLRGTLRTSTPTDLVLRLSSECALWTDITVVGDTTSEAVATVKMWVEIDGVPVKVSSGDTGEEAGKVVFCNRAFKMTTLNWDEDQTLETYLSTRSANAFNWMALNVGSGIHTVVVMAQLETEVTGVGEAKAGVGKRTLIVEPVKLAGDVVL